MLAHDPLILLAPLLLHLLELGLADHRVDSGAEMARHALGAADPAADLPHHPRQILRADHHQPDDRDQEKLGIADAEHGPRASGA